MRQCKKVEECKIAVKQLLEADGVLSASVAKVCHECLVPLEAFVAFALVQSEENFKKALEVVQSRSAGAPEGQSWHQHKTDASFTQLVEMASERGGFFEFDWELLDEKMLAMEQAWACNLHGPQPLT